MDAESTPSALPRVRTRARATARFAGARRTRRAGSAGDVQLQRRDGRATPSKEHRAVSSAPPNSNVTTRGSSTASLSSLDDVVDVSPGAAPNRRAARGCSSLTFARRSGKPPWNAPQTQSGRRSRPLPRGRERARASRPRSRRPAVFFSRPSTLAARATLSARTSSLFARRWRPSARGLAAQLASRGRALRARRRRRRRGSIQELPLRHGHRLSASCRETRRRRNAALAPTRHARREGTSRAMRRSTLTMTFDPLVSPTRRISPCAPASSTRAGHTRRRSAENAASAKEWPLRPVSEVMPQRARRSAC